MRFRPLPRTYWFDEYRRNSPRYHPLQPPGTTLHSIFILQWSLFNKLRFVILFTLLLSLAGCDPSKRMRERFGDNTPHILFDVDGHAYLVTHTTFGCYTVQPVK